MSPLELTILAICVSSVGIEGAIHWQIGGVPFASPSAQEIIKLPFFAIISFGTLSLLIWSVIYAPWYSIPVAVVPGAICVLIVRNISVLQTLIILIGPPAAAVGLLALHVVTWFR
jgi:hypothetical protein